MKAGLLRRRVTIQAATVTQDAFGSPVNSWATHLADVPCSLDPLSGREFLAAEANQSQVTCNMTMRYVSGILPTMRVVTEDAETYVIRAVLPDSTGRKSIVLMLEKGVASE